MREFMYLAGLTVAAFGAFIVGITLLLIFISIPMYYAEQRACNAYAEQTDRETKFVDDWPWWWSCQVKTDSGYIDYSNLYQNETPDLINKGE